MCKLIIFAIFIGGEYIKERILLIFILLIFFTSLGSVAASDEMISDNLTSDVSLDDSFNIELSDDSLDIDDKEDSFVIDAKENSNENINSIKDSDINIVVLDDSSSIDDVKIVDNTNDYKKSSSSKKLSSAYDSRVNSNDIVFVSNSKSSKAVLSSPELIIIKDASYYGDSLNTIVQGIIDNARAGSTIQFTGSSYENLCLKISKPLNIVSKSGTRIKSIFNVPVFTILYGGSGTNISGFTTDLVGSFVDASGVSGISISKNKISTKRNALVLNEVYDSIIKDNEFLKFDTAIDISNSGGVSISKNNITPQNSDNTGIKIRNIVSKKGISILDNNIIGFNSRKTCTGILFAQGASNVYLKGNFIKNWYTAIDMPYSVNNVSMYNNTISNNGDGIIINGWINNFTFKKNLVLNNGRVGILFDDNFKGTKGKLDLENNYFSYNGVLDLQNKGDQAVSIGKNFAARKCYRVGMKYTFRIKSRQSGGKYYFSVVDKYGNAISDLPNFSAKLTVNGKTYTVTFIDGKAYINGGTGANGKGGSGAFLDVGEDNRNLNQWGQFEEIDSDEMSYYEEIFNQLAGIIHNTDMYDHDEDSEADEFNNESGSSQSGSGSGDSGLSQGSNSISMNGNSGGSSGAAGAASVSGSPSASSSSSPSASPEDASSIKTLSVDDETFRVVGVGGLVLLIILVIGLYYREDILEMVKDE